MAQNTLDEPLAVFFAPESKQALINPTDHHVVLSFRLWKRATPRLD